jgi:hypothetical protein
MLTLIFFYSAKVILYWTCPCLDEMILEKPSWIRHEGLQIFSIDIQTGGLRFATGGGYQKVSSVFPLQLALSLSVNLQLLF